MIPGTALEVTQQSLSVQARVSWLPIDARHGGFIEHEEGRHAGTDRDREIGRGDLFQIELDHHVLGDLPAFGGTILQALKPILHLGDAALEPCCQGFVGQCRADDGGDDLVQIGQALNGVGEGLLIYMGVLGANAVTDRLVGDGGKFQVHVESPTPVFSHLKTS